MVVDEPGLPGLRPGTAAFEQRRRDSVWQSRVPDRYPAAIVDVVDVDGARRAMVAAERAGKRVAVISSGHSYIGHGVRDDVVLLDLRRFAHVRVDVERRTARVGPGATNGYLDARLEEVGLAFPVGHSPTVAVGGYLLGGGIGWNPDGWGVAACWSVISAVVLCANGEVVTADEQHHPDLFFALRGAGPLFPGIVLEFEIALVDRPRSITELTCRYPVGEVDRIAVWFRGHGRGAGGDVERSLTFFRADGRDLIAATAVAFADDPESASRVLDTVAAALPAASLQPPLQRTRRLRDLMADNDSPPQRYEVDGAWTTDSAHVLQACAAALRTSPSTDSLLHVSVRHERDAPGDMAFASPGPVFVFTSAVWDDPADDAANVAWQDATVASVASFRVGSYSNETDYIRDPHRLIDSFSTPTWKRLATVRRRYDPDNLFSAPEV